MRKSENREKSFAGAHAFATAADALVRAALDYEAASEAYDRFKAKEEKKAALLTARFEAEKAALLTARFEAALLTARFEVFEAEVELRRAARRYRKATT